MKTSSRYAVALLSVAAGALSTAPSAHAARMFAIERSNNQLRTFDSATPGTPLSSIGITGLALGEVATGIDVRPATGELYAVTSASRLYVLNPVSGAATAVGSAAFSPPLTGSIGMDINPVVDRVRLVNDAGMSLRVNPVTGVATQDTSLNPGTPNVTAVAYSNNFSGATSTTLYDIDTSSDSLARQNPPNNGTLSLVGSLGHDVGSATGFDIDSTGTAYGALSVGGVNGLYTIDLATGAASGSGSTGASLLDGLTVDSPVPAPVGVDVPSRVVTETSGTTPITLRRTGGSLMGAVTVDVAVAGGTATSPGDFVAQSTTATFAAGAATTTVDVHVVDDQVYESNEFFQLTISNARNATHDAQIASPATTIIGITDDETAPVNTGPVGLTGAPGPAGANATSLFVALGSARVSISRRARLRVAYVANARFGVKVQVLKGRKVLASARQTAKPGRNRVSFAAKTRFKPGRYVLRLTAGSGAARSVDRGKLVVRKR
jgi:Domain of unknown function (DUF4394)/Calx-beta domain